MPHFIRLSDEVITMVCTYLPSGSLARFAQTCRAINPNAIRVLYLRDAQDEQGDGEGGSRAIPYAVRLACTEQHNWEQRAAQVVLRSLFYGANINRQGLDRQTALTVATTHDNIKWIRSLIGRGANPSTPCFGQQYHYATFGQYNFREVRAIAQDLHIARPWISSWTPLCIPLVQNSREAVDLLLDAGASADVMIYNGGQVRVTAHHVCAMQEVMIEMTRSLTKRFPDSINSTTSENGFTPLWLSIDYLNKSAFDAILPLVQDLDRRSSRSQESPLHKAIKQIHITRQQMQRTKLCNMVEALVEAAADVNATDEIGRTPLLEAVDGMNVDYCGTLKELKGITYLLLENGAEINHMTPDGKTVMETLAKIIASHGKTTRAALETLFENLVADHHGNVNPVGARASVLGSLFDRWGNKGATNTNTAFIKKLIGLGAVLYDREAANHFDNWIMCPPFRNMYNLWKHKDHIPQEKIDRAYLESFESGDFEVLMMLLSFQAPSTPEFLLATTCAPKAPRMDAMIQVLLGTDDLDFDWQDDMGRSFIHLVVERFLSNLDPGYKYARAIADAQLFIDNGTSLELTDKGGKNAIQRLRNGKMTGKSDALELHLVRARDKERGELD